MQPKISKTLENMMARVVFRTTRAHLNTTLGDRLALEILREEGSLAYRLIATRLREWEIADALKRLDHHIGAVAAYKVGGINPERYFKTLTGELISSFPAAAKISTAHALIHLLSEPHSPTLTTFEMYGMNAFILTHELQRLIDGEEPTPVTAAANDNSNSNENNKNNGGNEVMICKYGADLTRQAHEGRIDPITGRETEIERMIQVLSRRKKNNPLLVGEAGVGKSALVEGLALRLAAGSVPYTLQGKRLIALDLTALLAGTRYRGEFEERMQRLIDELKRADDVIVFIDEIHTIVGAGAAGGSLDTANILKPALARSEIQTIGATTLDEYRQYFASDAALERRFQRIIIEPTSPQESTEHYHTALEQHFPPELMNRIDDIVVFRRLSAADTEKILELELAPIIDRVRRLGFTLRITDEAKRHLSRTGFESRYGVRALRRTLKEQIEEPLSQLILSGSIDRGATIIAETEQRQVIRLKVA